MVELGRARRLASSRSTVANLSGAVLCGRRLSEPLDEQQRVEKLNNSTSYVYNEFGRLASEFDSAAWLRDYARAGAQTIATENASATPGTTCYLSVNYLGITRMVTDQNGNVVARHDDAPFGQEIPAGVNGRTSLWGASDNALEKFTGQVRDAETDLDFFHARYLSSGLARFTSPDPYNAGADITNPQSWNGYAYVLESSEFGGSEWNELRFLRISWQHRLRCK